MKFLFVLLLAIGSAAPTLPISYWPLAISYWLLGGIIFSPPRADKAKAKSQRLFWFAHR
jgi:hypothetical protein